MRPLGRKANADKKRHFSDVLRDIRENQLRLRQLIGDNPMRSFLKYCKCHSGWYACEYCFGKGRKIEITDNGRAKAKIMHQINLVQEKINECEHEPNNEIKIRNLVSLKKELKKSANALNRKSNILWPYSTMHSTNRSRRAILEIVEKIERQENLSIDESKGIMGRSLLLDVPEFNFIYDSPAEYMNSGCLGLIKRLVELTFAVGVNRHRITNRKLSSTSTFNRLMLQTKVVHEFPRRARKLDFGVFKALEFRNLVLFFFPFVLECIEPDAKENNLWLNVVFMFRASVLPTQEFTADLIPIMNECCEHFYKLYEQLFDAHNCTYSIHVICAHLLEIRTHGPLTDTSAFKFESFYAELRRSFVPGTPSPLKQILQKVLLRRALSNHYCKNNILITNYETPMERNNLIYCYKNKEYLIYQVLNIDGETFSCNKVGQYPVTFNELPNVPWSSVGVFRKGGISSNTIHLNQSVIDGKVLNVGKYLITCPINVLHEK